MNDNLNTAIQILTIIGVVIGALSAVVLAWVSLTNRVQRQTVEQLQELTSALKTRVDSLEEERDELKTRVKTLEQENSALRSIVTGEVKVLELTAIVREHQEAVMSTLGEIRLAVAKS